MTCYTILKLAQRWGLCLKHIFAEVSAIAATTDGTSAGLGLGDKLTIQDLLHGMILPSGNDAAVCLAEHFGKLLFKERLTCSYSLRMGASCKTPYQQFVNEMNENAKLLGLSNTSYANVHGLANKLNKSTALDVAKLAAAAMRLPAFREIVGCKTYSCRAFNVYSSQKFFSWENTHKLLCCGFSGVKTGVTLNAGPCLCSSIDKEGTSLIVVLLNSKSMDARWTETIHLVDWTLLYLRKLRSEETQTPGAENPVATTAQLKENDLVRTTTVVAL